MCWFTSVERGRDSHHTSIIIYILVIYSSILCCTYLYFTTASLSLLLTLNTAYTYEMESLRYLSVTQFDTVSNEKSSVQSMLQYDHGYLYMYIYME